MIDVAFLVFVNVLFFRNGGGLDLKWYVSTNEDVGDFRVQVQSRSYPRSTLFR